jgi:cation diffusion facilitator CzcD-associated flavoprotein CzcO
MSFDRYGVKAGEHIPGLVLHHYLTDFAKKFGVFDRMQFNTRVDSVKPSATGGWSLTCSSPALEKEHVAASTVATKKLIVATGLTSTPNFPVYPGAETFGGPIFHAKDFGVQGDTIKTASKVVIVGGAKSAYDIAWAYVNAGATVDLVIRPDGNGPIWISYPWVMGGKKRLEKLLHVRFLTWFSPSPFEGADGYLWPRRFLHGTRIGRWIVNKFWATLGADVIQGNGFDKHTETKKLTPWNPAFWIGSGLSIHNYDSNFFDMVKMGKVRLHVANITSLSKRVVHLSTGNDLTADILICATGWKKEPSIKFTDMGSSGIGLPQSAADQRLLAAEADAQLLRVFPRLKDQPRLNFTPKPDPLRLYRFIAPPALMTHRNIAFAGLVSSVSTAICATVQALWISAFLDSELKGLPDVETEKGREEVARSTLLHTQWGVWRHPTGYGGSVPDFAFDSIPYTDVLLGDLGLKVRRKGGDDGGWLSWFREISEPYGPEDYIGLVGEWSEARQARGSKM